MMYTMLGRSAFTAEEWQKEMVAEITAARKRTWQIDSNFGSVFSTNANSFNDACCMVRFLKLISVKRFMKHITADNCPFVPASHEDPQNPGVMKRVIATADILQLGQVMMVNWARLPAGHKFNRHYHEDMQEVFVLLSGSVAMTVDGEVVQMSSGDTVIVDPREIHEMKNIGTDTAEYIVFGISSGEDGKTVVVE